MFGSNYMARDWTLIANALDHSMMRNYSAYFLGSLLSGLDFSPARHFVHLFMAGEYRGVYMLSDQLEPERIGLTLHPDPMQSEYLLEFDRRAPGGDRAFFIVQNMPFDLRAPSSTSSGSPFTEGHRLFAKSFIERVDAAFVGGDIDKISQIIDVPSFVDFYLVQEFFKNRDVNFSSVWFQIRQGPHYYWGHKLYAGPLWDFDQSSGSNLRPTDGTEASPHGAFAAIHNRHFRLLMNTDWFREKAGVRWEGIRDREVQTMIERIKNLAVTYQSCFEYNFVRWPDKNVWWTHPDLVSLSFMEQVEFLIDWFEQRKRWMDSFFE